MSDSVPDAVADPERASPDQESRLRAESDWAAFGAAIPTVSRRSSGSGDGARDGPGAAPRTGDVYAGGGVLFGAGVNARSACAGAGMEMDCLEWEWEMDDIAIRYQKDKTSSKSGFRESLVKEDSERKNKTAKGGVFENVRRKCARGEGGKR
jgi:hypothetical protein